MLAARLRPVIEPLTSGVGRALARAHLSPNALTSIGLAGTIFCAWLIADGHPRIAGVILIAPMIVDVLDGATARATGRVTVWGGFYDSVADRVGDGALFAGIAWLARIHHPRELAAALTAMVFTFCVPYARAKAESVGLRTVPGPGERAERAVILIVGLIFSVVEPALWVVSALTLWTFVTRVATVWRQTARV
ncbi:MAG: CDP-alcohol phosphatidyltransferase family protein [Actinomycetota bacterium]|nr:CDP-alcohol phosphatidyltransferase family protein [Actinomycetota bacterium]